jgi:hypothetical protein
MGRKGEKDGITQKSDSYKRAIKSERSGRDDVKSNSRVYKTSTGRSRSAIWVEATSHFQVGFERWKTFSSLL